MASLRPFMPRVGLSLSSKQLRHRLYPITLRAASTAPPKPRVLEKPERFNPPSHPSRRTTRRGQYPGPPMSEHEREAQKTRRYPHMMPPKGTFMHWFLTSRVIHVYITLTILFGLLLGTWWMDFIHNSPDKALFPPHSMFFTDPFSFIQRYFQVYVLYVEHTSAESRERRRQNNNDALKRREYRKEHGQLRWWEKSDQETREEEWRERNEKAAAEAAAAAARESPESRAGPYAGQLGADGAVAVNGQQSQKKWFGIW